MSRTHEALVLLILASRQRCLEVGQNLCNETLVDGVECNVHVWLVDGGRNHVLRVAAKHTGIRTRNVGAQARLGTPFINDKFFNRSQDLCITHH